MESKCYQNSWGKAWKNSKRMRHREDDLPAIEDYNGYKAWYINGKRHREIGPAIICSNGDEHWYLNDVEYTPEKMPIKLFLSYLKWELKKKHGI